MNLASHVEPDANFDDQRRLIAHAPILQPVCVVRWPARLRAFASPNGTVRSLSPDEDDRHEACCTIDP